MAQQESILKTVAISVGATLGILYLWTKYNVKKPVPAMVIPSPPVMPITFLDNSVTNLSYTYDLADNDCEVILEALEWSGAISTDPNIGVTRNIDFVLPSKIKTPSANLYEGRVVNITNLGYGNDNILINNNGDIENVVNLNNAQLNFVPGFMENSKTAVAIYTGTYNSWTCIYKSSNDTWYCYSKNNNYRVYTGT